MNYIPHDNITVYISPETHPLILNILEELEKVTKDLELDRFLRREVLKLRTITRESAIEKLREFVTIKGK